ncbi:unnamed protein product [Angiostrongylus costaricensis]|uniref:Secreted protein n=1 Tax=Angiostrongylus costaricensis TaxID=334426 RepID=A0A0R3PEF1_ANGCS|nr:unnamed protein product [Angiostrongylus costaricensis]
MVELSVYTMKCIWLFGLVILCRCNHCVTSCEWLNGIRPKIFGKVEGNGLHRMLIVSSALASVNRFSDCRLLYEVEIPEGVYVNLNRCASSTICRT